MVSELPQGEMAVVYWEGDDPRAALQKFASSNDPFDQWLKERGREVYHFEPSQTQKTRKSSGRKSAEIRSRNLCPTERAATSNSGSTPTSSLAGRSC